jgi:hypothetical protein
MSRLAVYGAFLVTYVGICYYNNLVVPMFIGGTHAIFIFLDQLRSLTLLALEGLVTVPYGFGMYESKQQLDAKKLR